MRLQILFFAISFFIISLFSAGQKLNPNTNSPGFNASYKEYALRTNSSGGELKYVRVFKNGKWWIYVYDGVELVDIYPE